MKRMPNIKARIASTTPMLSERAVVTPVIKSAAAVVGKILAGKSIFLVLLIG